MSQKVLRFLTIDYYLTIFIFITIFNSCKLKASIGMSNCLYRTPTHKLNFISLSFTNNWQKYFKQLKTNSMLT